MSAVEMANGNGGQGYFGVRRTRVHFLDNCVFFSSRPVLCTMRETRPQYNGWLQCILEITDVRRSRREADRRLRYQAPSDIGSAAADAASMTTGEAAVFTL